MSDTLPQSVTALETAISGIVAKEQILQALADRASQSVLGFPTVAAMTASTRLFVGDLVMVGGGSGATGETSRYEIVAAGSHTAVGTDVINLTGISGQALLRDKVSVVVPRSIGECRFEYVSATACQLIPHDGNIIQVAGSHYEIPAIGVTLSNTGIGNDQLRFIYAFVSSGTLTLEQSTTAPEISDTVGSIGVNTKTGDVSRTLVGMAKTDASGEFVDALTASYFNKKRRYLEVTDSTNRTVATSGFSAFHSALRLEFVCFAEDSIAGAVQAGGANTSGGTNNTISMLVDGNDDEIICAKSWRQSSSGDLVDANAAGIYVGPISQGFHFVTLEGACSGGTLAVLPIYAATSFGMQLEYWG